MRIPHLGGICFIAGKQAIISTTGIFDDKPWCIGVTLEIFAIYFLCGQQFMDECTHKQTISAGLQANPLIGNGGVTGFYGVDGYKFGSPALESSQSGFDGVGCMIFGHAKEQEVFRMLPVGLTKFPEGTAECIEASRCHVHRAEAAVGCIIWCTELRGPPARQALALVTTGEEGKLLGVAIAHLGHPQGCSAECFLPFNFAKFTRAAFAHTDQWFGQSGG